MCFFLSANDFPDTYRITIIANTTPITTITNAPTAPPIVTCKLFDGEEYTLKPFEASIKTSSKTYMLFKKIICIAKLRDKPYHCLCMQRTKYTLFRSIPLSHCMPSLQPNKQLPLILSHLLFIQFSLQRYWQFSPYDSEHSEMF